MDDHVDLNAVLKAQIGRGMERMASGFDQDGRLLNNIAANKFGSLDLIEAAAGKELAKAGMGSDVAGLNTGAATPKGKV